MKMLIVLALLAILVALGSAGLFMLKRPHDPAAAQAPDKRMARSLALRVGLSVTVFLLVMLGWAMGWIQPTGLPTGR
jgi:putative copper export protein